MNDAEGDDVALKLLHTADWHLGKRFPGFSDADEQRLTRARLEAVERILDLAQSYRVDAVLCAGDLFDEPTPEKVWWQGLAELLGRRDWRERPVFLLPGNHDALTADSVYRPEHEFRRALPAGVHVVDRQDFEHPLGPEAVLYAACCESRSGSRDLALELPERRDGDQRLRIGMVHGQTFDLPGHQTNFPIALDAAARRGLDYLAIGDTHSFRDVTPEAAVPTVYPGAPEATGFREPEAGHVAIVLFRRRGRRPLVQKEKVGTWEWREETCRSLADLRSLRESEGLRQTALRLVLDMEVSLAEEKEIDRLLDELAGTAATHGRAGILKVDRQGLRLAPSGAEDFPAELPPVLAAVVERLETMQGGGEGELAQKALSHLYKLVTEEA